MAILLWVASGIRQKMTKDITTAKAYRQHFKEAFWTRNGTVAGNVPLTMRHVAPSFIFLGFGLMPVVVAFFLELLYRLYQRRVANPSTSARPPGRYSGGGLGRKVKEEHDEDAIVTMVVEDLTQEEVEVK